MPDTKQCLHLHSIVIVKRDDVGPGYVQEIAEGCEPCSRLPQNAPYLPGPPLRQEREPGKLEDDQEQVCCPSCCNCACHKAPRV